jgi:hypothetical protein
MFLSNFRNLLKSRYFILLPLIWNSIGNRDQQEHEPQYARKYLTSQILRVFSESKLSSELVPIQEPVNKESLPTGKYQISLDIGIPCFFQQRNYQGY